jgi:hypothetical protein
MPKNVTIGRTVRIKDCFQDFGLGEGIIYKDFLKINAVSETMASVAVIQENKQLLEDLVEIEMTIIKPKRKKAK